MSSSPSPSPSPSPSSSTPPAPAPTPAPAPAPTPTPAPTPAAHSDSTPDVRGTHFARLQLTSIEPLSKHALHVEVRPRKDLLAFAADVNSAVVPTLAVSLHDPAHVDDDESTAGIGSTFNHRLVHACACALLERQRLPNAQADVRALVDAAVTPTGQLRSVITTRNTAAHPATPFCVVLASSMHVAALVPRHTVVVARLPHPTHLGAAAISSVHFVVLVGGGATTTDASLKATKSALEVGRMFASLMAHASVRASLHDAADEAGMRAAITDFFRWSPGEQVQPASSAFERLVHVRPTDEEDTSTLLDDNVDSNNNNNNNNDAATDATDSAGRGAARQRRRRRHQDNTLEFTSMPPIPGVGIWNDLRRRLPHYVSDYTEAFSDGHPHTFAKTLSTTAFLYFACLLPAFAFGVLNNENTNGHITIEKMVFSQGFSGLVFAVFGGQPLIVLLSTSPLALYMKVIYSISDDQGWDFFSVFAATGLFNALFLALFAFFEVSVLLRYSTRFAEETFGFFISIAFSVDALRPLVTVFIDFFWSCTEQLPCLLNIIGQALTPTTPPRPDGGDNATTTTTLSAPVAAYVATLDDAQRTAFEQLHAAVWNAPSTTTAVNASSVPTQSDTAYVSADVVVPGGDAEFMYDLADTFGCCQRDVALMWAVLMFSSLWIGLRLYSVKRSMLLTPLLRMILSDYSLPISILCGTILGSVVLDDVYLKPFAHDDDRPTAWKIAPFDLNGAAWGASAGFGLLLSMLFFTDHNISSKMANNDENRLRKGHAYHLDMLVLAVINAVLSLFGLPWLNAALPHSPLHVRALADTEKVVVDGHMFERVVWVREQRITVLASSALILATVFALPTPAQWIPVPVLYSLFLYVAITALETNQFFGRLLLLFTQQSNYAPNHYVRRVPQRRIHLFTAIQALAVAVLCLFAFFPNDYMRMLVPFLLLMLLPLKPMLLRRIFDAPHLRALEGEADEDPVAKNK